jgi:3'-5' exoribonuclease
MATADMAEILGLADIVVGRSGVCFAVLVKHEEKISSRQEPYVACVFRAKNVTRTAKIWANNQCITDIRACQVGSPYRLTAVGEKAYGSDLKILRIEPATAEHECEGFRVEDLLASSELDVEELRNELRTIIDDFSDPHLRELVRGLLRTHRELFLKMPAASSFHHAYNAGLLEHVWSLTRVCKFLADHYADYYRQLDPPLNKDMVLAAAIVHDIGKLVELNYDQFEPTYSTLGKLIGHVVIGRDMVRDAAGRIEGFPEETLMLLEHAILSHHGKREWGAPVLPQTIEALLVSFADDLDAKINAAARARLLSRTADDFTEPVRPLEGRVIYKGIPLGAPEMKLVVAEDVEKD